MTMPAVKLSIIPPVFLWMVVAFTLTPELTMQIGALLGVVFAGIVSILKVRADILRGMADVAAMAQKAADDAAEEAKKAAELLVGIDKHVNSAATKAAEIIASQEIQLKMLRDTVVAQEKTASLLAQAQANRDVLIAAATPAPIVQEPAAAHGTLEKIEGHTEDTALGVRDLKDRNETMVEAVQELKDQGKP